MNYRLLLTWILALLCIQLLAQDNTLNIVGHQDCETRLKLLFNKTIGPSNSPVGYGNKLEFESQDTNDSLFIEKETHSVWYEFIPKSRGNLMLQIEPLDSLDDYDFSLYEYTDSNFCSDVFEKKIKPLRSNLSRNKIALKGKTGLAKEAKSNWIGTGLQPAYSKTLYVYKNKPYVLFLNNVYEEGGGHILHFDFDTQLQVQGNVVEIGSNKSMQANISLTNTKTGLVLARAISDSLTGDYQLNFEI